MKKKFLLALLAICLVSPIALSAKAFDFNVGATAQYQNIIQPGETPDWGDLADIDNYRFGAEVRMNFLLVEVVNTTLVGAYKNATDFNLRNHLAAGIYFDLLDVLRLGVDVGPEISMNFNGSGMTDDAGNTINFLDALKKANCNYKAHGDILIGDGLTLSLSYTLPTKFNIETLDWTALLPQGNDWAQGRYGVSLLFF